MNGIAYAWQGGPTAWVEAGTASPSDMNLWIIGIVYLALATLGLVVDIGLAVYFLLRPRHLAPLRQRLILRAWPADDAWRIGLILLTLFTLVLVARMVVDLMGAPAPLDDPRFWVILQSALFHWIGLLLIVAYTRRCPAAEGSHFGLDRRTLLSSIGWGVVFYLASIPFIWFYTLIYQTGLQQLGYETTLQQVADILTDEQPGWLRVYFFFMGTVLAPCFEEVLFRGVALPLLARRWGFVPALFALSALFALIHFHLPSLVPLFLLSTAFSLAYIYTGSILAPIVMHGIFNAVNLGLMSGLKGL